MIKSLEMEKKGTEIDMNSLCDVDIASPSAPPESPTSFPPPTSPYPFTLPHPTVPKQDVAKHQCCCTSGRSQQIGRE